MRHTLWILFLAFAIGPASAQQPEPPQTKPAPLDWNQAALSPRSHALEVAAEGKSQGYAMRDGFWSGTLEKGQPVVLAVHLFAWNDYRFTAAHLEPGSRIRLSIFDRWGNAAGGQESTGETSATADFSAVRSDRYYIQLELTEGDKAQASMVYSYK
jgi:hypothetical protein